MKDILHTRRPLVPTVCSYKSVLKTNHLNTNLFYNSKVSTSQRPISSVKLSTGKVHTKAISVHVIASKNKSSNYLGYNEVNRFKQLLYRFYLVEKPFSPVLRLFHRYILLIASIKVSNENRLKTIFLRTT